MNLEFENYWIKSGLNIIIEPSSFKFTKGINLLLGRNGSGKTSILKSIINLNTRWGGKILFDRSEIAVDKMKQNFGFQFEVEYLPNNLYPEEMMLFTADIQGIGKEEAKDKSFDLLNFFEITANKEIQFLSYGNKKKLLLALSLLSSPKGIFWDEPFEGLDDFILHKLIDFLIKSDMELIVISTNNLNISLELGEKGIVIGKDKKVANFNHLDITEIRNII